MISTATPMPPSGSHTKHFEFIFKNEKYLEYFTKFLLHSLLGHKHRAFIFYDWCVRLSFDTSSRLYNVESSIDVSLRHLADIFFTNGCIRPPPSLR